MMASNGLAFSPIGLPPSLSTPKMFKDDLGGWPPKPPQDDEGWDGGQDMASLRKMPRKFSNDIRDMNQVRCKVCDKVLLSYSMKEHVKTQHKEIKGTYGSYEYVKYNFYRCKLCPRELPFCFKNISSHVNKVHRMDIKTYKESCMGLDPNKTYSELVEELGDRSDNESDTESGTLAGNNSSGYQADKSGYFGGDNGGYQADSSAFDDDCLPASIVDQLLAEAAGVTGAAQPEEPPPPEDDDFYGKPFRLFDHVDPVAMYAYCNGVDLETAAAALNENVGSGIGGDLEPEYIGHEEGPVSPAFSLKRKNMEEEVTQEGYKIRPLEDYKNARDEEEEDEDDFDYSVLEAACSIEVGEVDLDVPAVPILASMRESLLEEESPDHRLHSDIPTDMCQVICNSCGEIMPKPFFSQIHNCKHLNNTASKFTFVKKVYHSCKVCGESLLFCPETIRDHMKEEHGKTCRTWKKYFEDHLRPRFDQETLNALGRTSPFANILLEKEEQKKEDQKKEEDSDDDIVEILCVPAGRGPAMPPGVVGGTGFPPGRTGLTPGGPGFSPAVGVTGLTPGMGGPVLPPGMSTKGLSPGLGGTGLPPGMVRNGLSPSLSKTGLSPGLGGKGLSPGLCGTGFSPVGGTGNIPPGVGGTGIPPRVGGTSTPPGIGGNVLSPGLNVPGFPPGILPPLPPRSGKQGGRGSKCVLTGPTGIRRPAGSGINMGGPGPFGPAGFGGPAAMNGYGGPGVPGPPVGIVGGIVGGKGASSLTGRVLEGSNVSSPTKSPSVSPGKAANARPRPSPAIKKDGDSNKVDEDVERGVTDDMNLVSKITCDICGFEMTKDILYHHFKQNHVGKKVAFTYTKKAYHKCKICDRSILFCPVSIKDHIRYHHPLSNMNWTKYKAEFLSNVPTKLPGSPCNPNSSGNSLDHKEVEAYPPKEDKASDLKSEELPKLTEKLKETSKKKGRPPKPTKKKVGTKEEREKSRQHTDNPDKICRVVCEECGEEMPKYRSSAHTYRAHPGKKSKMKPSFTSYHRCKFCSKSLVFCPSVVYEHVKYRHPENRLTWVQYKKIFLEPSADNPKGVDDDDHDDFGGLKEQADNGQRLSRLRKRVTF